MQDHREGWHAVTLASCPAGFPDAVAKSLIDKVTGGGSSTPSTAGGVGLGTVQDAISGLTGKVSNATDLGGLAGKISNATDKLTGLKDQVAPANSTLGKVLDTIASGGSTYDTSGGAEGAAQRIMNRDPTHWETINGNQTGLGGDMLAKFTAQMIAGQAGVYRQTVRIPVKAFLERACQVGRSCVGRGARVGSCGRGEGGLGGRAPEGWRA